MRTKYFLFGGATRKNKLAAERFFREVLNIPNDKVNILLVYFAKDKNKWTERSEMDINFISSLTDKKVNFTVADGEKFKEQVEEADIIYLQGGDGIKIKDALKKYDLKQLFDGKIIVGNSAGVNVLSRYYYDNDYDRIEEGLGVLPVKTVCHYKTEIEDKLSELKEYGEPLEAYAIPEGEYITMETE